MKTFPTSAVWCFGILFISVSLITTGSSEVQVVGPADPVVALAGDDVILPCSLKPNVSAEDMVVQWTRLNRKAEKVHLYLDSRDSNEDQSPSYRGRTSMFHEELKNGIVSLKLNRVTLSDTGSYRCFFPKLTSLVTETTVQLFVGAVSQPVISIDGTKGWGVVLKCESGGWFPEPQMEWLDSSGTFLPADGPPEKYRDSEDLYALRRHVTVNQTDTNRFTCRVHQTEINHLKETEIHVPDEVFPKSQVGLIVGLLIAAAVVVLAASVGVYMWRKHIEEKKRRELLEEQEKECRKLLEEQVKDFKLKRDVKRDAKFVKRNIDHLIQNVTMVTPIAFYLIRSEMYSKIHAARTRQGQMEMLYEALTFGGDHVKSDFYRILLDLEPDLVNDPGAIFVDVHKDQLIQRVTKVKPILHELFYEELYCNTRINQMTSQEQMRQLYMDLEVAEDSRSVKLDFYRILLDLESNLVRDLDELLNLPGQLDKLKIETVSSAGSNWTEDSDFYEVNKNLTVQLDKVTIERDELKEELRKAKSVIQVLSSHPDGQQTPFQKHLSAQLWKARETIQSLSTSPGGQQETQTPSQRKAREIQSLSTSPGGQQETQTPSQKSERIEGMEMKSLPGSGSLPEKRPLLGPGPQNDDLDEMERGGRVTIDNNSML
ncbi:selection and upkeep of intraepithelial T-cells protein 6-like isoform X1 [Oncorhynchus masou masou]|uniref:selection and upkeep of intraepithelial T-cells protein 6-like isoform X1 n=1 Tax=Oncorhynchus masou masou TaxID=90313 RepID=UPI003183868D